MWQKYSIFKTTNNYRDSLRMLTVFFSPRYFTSRLGYYQIDDFFSERTYRFSVAEALLLFPYARAREASLSDEMK